MDIIEKLPVPYGLVRFGVAPDHEDTKAVMTTFSEVANRENVRFLGNISIGSGCGDGDDGGRSRTDGPITVTLEQLRKSYSAVVLAIGASSDRKLYIPGEGSLAGVYSAREFVNWYNGHPDFVDLGEKLNLDKTTDVVVIGQGNVAIDIARVLTKSITDLSTTDIADHALEVLKTSTVRRVSLVARRSHVQTACTIKELREMTRIPNVSVTTRVDEMEMGDTVSNVEEVLSTRPRRRITELLESIPRKNKNGQVNIEISENIGAGEDDDQGKQIDLRFLLVPTALQPSLDDPSYVGGVIAARAALSGPAHSQKISITPSSSSSDTDTDTETDTEGVFMPAQLVLSSVGYQSEPLIGAPFDSHTHTIPSSSGRVEGEPGLYVSGWLKRGPTGIIGTNIPDAKETAKAVMSDIEAGLLPADRDGLSDVCLASAVTWEDYLKIECLEKQEGQRSTPPRPRRKLVHIRDLLTTAGKMK